MGHGPVKKEPLRARALVRIPDPQGLHARPCALLAKIAGKHKAQAWIKTPKGKADPRSVLELMILSAGGSEELEIEAEGADAPALVEALARTIRELDPS